MVEWLMLKYRQPQMEAECVRSFLEATHHPYSLKILDNRGGTKNMAQIWNRFISESTSDLVGVFDSDCLFTRHPESSLDWLTCMVDTLIRNPKAGAVLPVTNNCDGGRYFQVWEWDDPRPKVPYVVRNGEVTGFCFLLSREVWSEVGRFDEKFGFYGQDSDFFCRMALTSGWEVWVDPRAYVIHGNHSSRAEVSDETYDFERDKRDAELRFQRKKISYETTGNSFLG